MWRQCERLSNARYCTRVLLSVTTAFYAPVNMQGPPCHSVHTEKPRSAYKKNKKNLTHTKRNKMASCQDGSTGRRWSLLLLCYTSNKSKKKETLRYPSKYEAVSTVSKLWQIHNLISAVRTTREWVMPVCFYQQGVFTQFPNTIKPEDNTCTERLLALLVCQLWNQVPGEGGKTAINYWTSDQPNPP